MTRYALPIALGMSIGCWAAAPQPNPQPAAASTQPATSSESTSTVSQEDQVRLLRSWFLVARKETQLRADEAAERDGAAASCRIWNAFIDNFQTRCAAINNALSNCNEAENKDKEDCGENDRPAPPLRGPDYKY